MISTHAQYRRWGVVFFAIGWATPALGQWVDQSFTLQSGWNTVYLEVNPTEDLANSVFLTEPANAIELVWTWAPAVNSVNPGCADINHPDCLETPDSRWRFWVPPGLPGAVASTLTRVVGGQVYLIRAEREAVLIVRGKPFTARTQWQEGVNVVGLHVDYAQPPPLARYLAPSPYVADSAVFTLGTNGRLIEVANHSDPVEPGTGYWVSSNGFVEYDGPLSISAGSLFGLSFGTQQVEHRVDIVNLADRRRTVTLSILPSAETPSQPAGLPENAGVIPMKRRDFLSEQTLYELDDLDEAHPIRLRLDAANAGEPQRARSMLRISVARQGLPEAVVEDGGGSMYQSIFVVDDGAGFRRWFPVSAEVPDQAGLYVGTVSVDAVAWIQADSRIVLRPDEEGGYEDPEWDCNRNGASDTDDVLSGTSQDTNSNQIPDECEELADTTVPRPTHSPFAFPVIIHRDGQGTYTFLNEVTLLYHPGEGQGTDRYVLATPDCQNCDQLSAGSMIDGEPFARRMATAAFSFEHDLPLTGSFATTLEGTTIVSAEDPLNPFRHNFHPGHDGDTAREVFAVSRVFAFDFTCAPPDGRASPPGLGDTLLQGCYSETLGGVTAGEPPGEYLPGLHRQEINVSGRFDLHRVSNISVLNDGQGGGIQ